MFSLLSEKSLRSRLWTELPALLAAMTIAEIFYKFHSFLLETIAFLVTWYVFAFVLHLAQLRFTNRPVA